MSIWGEFKDVLIRRRASSRVSDQWKNKKLVTKKKTKFHNEKKLSLLNGMCIKKNTNQNIYF